MALHGIPNCYICNHFLTVIITCFNCQIFHVREEKIFSSSRNTHTHTLFSSVVVFPCLLEPSLWTLSHCSGRCNGVDVGKPSHRNSESSLSAIMDPLSAGHSTPVAKDILYWVLAWANLSSFGTCTWTIQDNNCKALHLSVQVFPRWVLLLF